jgi:hypothetical protein
MQVQTARDLRASGWRGGVIPDSEIVRELLHPPMAFHYMAAEMARATLAYRRASGYDISNRPDIICSLYQLGSARKRAAVTRQQGRVPRATAYGLFAQVWLVEAERILKDE